MEEGGRMMNRCGLLAISYVMVIAIVIMASPARGQDFPDGLVGISTGDPGAVYLINESTGDASLLATMNRTTSLVGAAFLGETLYGVDICIDDACNNYTAASVSTSGAVNVISNQNGSSNWWSLAADETANVMYSVDMDNSRILSAQFPNGSIQTIGAGTGLSVAGLAYDDTNGILYAATSDSFLYTISTTDGTPTLIGPTGVPESLLIGLEYDECSQVLYLNHGALGQLYTVNVSTGAATLVGSNGVEATIDGLAWKGSCEPPPPPPAPEQIPTLSEWGLIIMAALIGIAGILTFGKRRITT